LKLKATSLNFRLSRISWKTRTSSSLDREWVSINRDSFLFDLWQQDDCEMMYFCQEKASGLKAIVAIHDTILGPAAGRIRIQERGYHEGEA
jgi:hypothetical protein